MSFLSVRDVNADAAVLKVTHEPGDTLNTGSVTISSTSTLIVNANAARRSITIRNLSTTTTIYIKGGTGATVSNFPLKSEEALSDIKYTGIIHAITASGTASVAYIEEVA